MVCEDEQIRDDTGFGRRFSGGYLRRAGCATVG
jgi:hypothetical protein